MSTFPFRNLLPTWPKASQVNIWEVAASPFGSARGWFRRGRFRCSVTTSCTNCKAFWLAKRLEQLRQRSRQLDSAPQDVASCANFVMFLLFAELTRNSHQAATYFPKSLGSSKLPITTNALLINNCESCDKRASDRLELGWHLDDDVDLFWGLTSSPSDFFCWFWCWYFICCRQLKLQKTLKGFTFSAGTATVVYVVVVYFVDRIRLCFGLVACFQPIHLLIGLCLAACC